MFSIPLSTLPAIIRVGKLLTVSFGTAIGSCPGTSTLMDLRWNPASSEPVRM